MTLQDKIGLIENFTEYLKTRLIDRELDCDTETTIEDIVHDFIVSITYDILDNCETKDCVDEKLDEIEYYLKDIFVKNSSMGYKVLVNNWAKNKKGV